MSFRVAVLTLSMGLLLSGCSEGAFSDGTVSFILGTNSIRLDGEQVFLTNEQLQCGVGAELWEIQSLGEERSVGRLTQKGRDLKFADDIQISRDTQRLPKTQVRGDFRIAVQSVVEIHDANANTKIADVKAGPIIEHSCFGDRNPPRLMGVRKGDFTQDSPARFEFRQNGNWAFERILH